MAVATREPIHMGSVQRPPNTAPSASSSDRPPLRRCERISPVKNRMLEIGTSGTVRGEDRNILTYSALRPEWRGEHGQSEAEQPDHPANLGDSITASNSDKVFGTHRPWRDARSVYRQRTVEKTKLLA